VELVAFDQWICREDHAAMLSDSGFGTIFFYDSFLGFHLYTAKWAKGSLDVEGQG
jgi:hypothetical protein